MREKLIKKEKQKTETNFEIARTRDIHKASKLPIKRYT